MDTDDILHAIQSLPDPLHPSTQIARRAASEIETLRDEVKRLAPFEAREKKRMEMNSAAFRNMLG